MVNQYLHTEGQQHLKYTAIINAQFMPSEDTKQVGALRCLWGSLARAGWVKIGRYRVMFLAIVALSIALFIVLLVGAFFIRELLIPPLFAVLPWIVVWIAVFICVFALLLLPILGLSELVRWLPMLISETKVWAITQGTKPPQCMEGHFGGDAGKVLGRVFSYLFWFLVLMIFVAFIAFGLISTLIRSLGIYVPGDSMTLTTALIILNVVIITVLLIITIITQPNPNTTHIVNEARIFVLTWFTAILVLSLLAITEPPVSIITILLTLITAITIDTAIYVTLTTTIINHLKTQTPIDHNV
jgi:hypothetical protein